MDARTRNAKHHVTFAHKLGADHAGTVHHTHHEARQVVVCWIHHARMLGHLAAYQRTTSLATSLCYATHDLRHRVRFKLSHSYVVKEEKRLGSYHHYVVSTHGDQVLAHRVMLLKQLSNCKLGSHAISATYEHGIFHILHRRSRKTATEASQATDHFRSHGARDHVLDCVYGTRALVHVYTGIRISNVLRHEISFCLALQGLLLRPLR